MASATRMARSPGSAGAWKAQTSRSATPPPLWRPLARREYLFRFDAFQWTSLEPLLRGLHVTDLVICGVVTNLCVETTVRSAFMRDFPVTLLADCCAAKTRRLHDLSIEVLSSYELAEIANVCDGFTFKV
jgi:nicotinamidase-related amidase